MQAAIDRVMQAYGMIVNLTLEQERDVRDKVSRHLAGKSERDENRLAVEGLRYVRTLKA